MKNKLMTIDDPSLSVVPRPAVLYRAAGPIQRYPGTFWSSIKDYVTRQYANKGNRVIRKLTDLPERTLNITTLSKVSAEAKQSMMQDFSRWMNNKYPNLPVEDTYLYEVLVNNESDFPYPTVQDNDYLRSKGYSAVYFEQEGGEKVDTWYIIGDRDPRVLENEMDHAVALKKTGFWGRSAAGCLFQARDTGRICIAHRSDEVEKANTWGTWGGAIDQGESPEAAVKREVQEEAGYYGEIELVPLYVFKHISGFTYYNFLALVETEFDPKLNWETQGYKWVDFGNWPRRLHPGLRLLLADNASMQLMKQYSTGDKMAKESVLESTEVSGASGTLPPEPGTVDIPVGTVRLYHQSKPDNLEKIAKTGLSIAHARGIEGPRAIYASERGFYGEPGRVPTLEFYVDRNKWDDPFVLEDVPPEQMIAIHLPWHSKARYILDNPDTLEKALSGDFDDLRDDYATAVEYVKRMKKNNLSESEQRWYYGNRQSINKNKIISENEGYKLSQLAKVGINMEDADFWLVRRGSIGDVGQPSRDWNPEDIGIKIVMTDLVQPKFFYYLMQYLWQAGYWRERAVGTTRLVNIRIEDVKNLVFGNK